MYKVTYTIVKNSDNLVEVVNKNLKFADLICNISLFTAAQTAYFKIYPQHDYQDLERYLRQNNFNTHLIANKYSNPFDLNYKLGMINLPNRNFEYQCIYSCRPFKNALQELLKLWPNYNDNFNTLKNAGNVILINDDSINKIKNISGKIFENGDSVVLTTDIHELISNNKIKINI